MKGSQSMPTRVFSEPKLGATARFSRTITEADVSLFIGVTWDVNPYHTDENFLQQTNIKGRIVPGLLTASMLTHLGGLWGFLADRMDLIFVAPVYIGETITAECQIV